MDYFKTLGYIIISGTFAGSQYLKTNYKLFPGAAESVAPGIVAGLHGHAASDGGVIVIMSRADKRKWPCFAI